ncbi:unnamed protein product, partial [Rangifer tarandus platyrhynchus]
CGGISALSQGPGLETALISAALVPEVNIVMWLDLTAKKVGKCKCGGQPCTLNKVENGFWLIIFCCCSYQSMRT